jgi:hypothetical protein
MPLAVLRDFSQAEAQAIRTVFGKVDYGDSFHFAQANVRWLHAHGASELRSTVAEDLRHLWQERDPMHFASLLETFRMQWRY